MPKRHPASPIAVESRILFLRHQRVILDVDLAELYGVPVRGLTSRSSAIETDFLLTLSFNSKPKNIKS